MIDERSLVALLYRRGLGAAEPDRRGSRRMWRTWPTWPSWSAFAGIGASRNEVWGPLRSLVERRGPHTSMGAAQEGVTGGLKLQREWRARYKWAL